MEVDKFNNLLELYDFQYKNSKSDDEFLISLQNLKNTYTWEEAHQNIIKLSNQLNSIIKKNDRCMLISENRPEWLIADLAIMMASGVTVPAYTTYKSKDYEYLIDDCKPAVIIISNKIQYNKIKDFIKNRKFIKKVFSFDEFKNLDNVENIKQIFLKQKFKQINLSNLKISRQDIACIIYTSGTQAAPKGVMLSHGGILSNCKGALSLLKEIIKDRPKFLTWLPLSHSYEHTVQFVQIAVGAKIFYAESIDKLVKNMNDCSPDIMTAVPRFYQNLYQKISSTFKKATGVKKLLVNSTTRIGKKYFLKEKLSIYEKFINYICNKLVRKKIQRNWTKQKRYFMYNLYIWYSRKSQRRDVKSWRYFK